MATLVCSWLAMTDEEEGDRTTEEDGNEMREGQTEFSFLQVMRHALVYTLRHTIQ